MAMIRSSKHTEKRQSVIEPSSPLVKTLVCDGKPFDLVCENGIPPSAQKSDIELI
jgi:hypothetical protein